MSSVEFVDKWVHVEHLVRGLLGVLGFSLEEDNNLKDTPARVARFYKEFFEYDSGNTKVAFESFSSDQLVAVRGIEAFSLCSHHMLPMKLLVHIGYIPEAPEEGGEVLGLSKMPRIVQKYAHDLQLQERLTCQIADHMEKAAKALGVAVVIEGEHMCMQMRGIKSSGTMITSVMRGAFRDTSERAREEFLSFIRR